MSALLALLILLVVGCKLVSLIMLGNVYLPRHWLLLVQSFDLVLTMVLITVLMKAVKGGLS